MGKKNNNSKQTNGQLEKDTQNLENTESQDTSSLSSNDSESKTDSKNKTSTTEPPKFSKVYIVELILAIIALGVLAYAIVRSGNKISNTDDNSPSADETVINADNPSDYIFPSDDTPVVIDNSVLFTDIPEIPDVNSYNTLTLTDCEKAVSDGTMLKITTASGIDVYVNNYENEDLLLENSTYTSQELDEIVFSEITSNFGESGECTHDIAQNGDTVNISYVGKINGEAFEGGTATDDLLLGSGSYIPGFEDGVVGMKSGDTKDVTVTFPADYFSTDLAGKDAVFTITLNEIVSTTVYPELTDELVQSVLPEVTSVDECYEYFKKVILEEKIWNYVAKDFYVSELDASNVNNYYTSTMNYYDAMSQSYQATVEDLIASSEQTIDGFKAEVMNSSAASCRYHIFYEAIMEYNNLSIGEEQYAEFAVAYGYDDIDAFIADYGKETIDDYLYQKEFLDHIADLRLELE